MGLASTRLIGPRAGPWAVAAFAIIFENIYYASEIKQYSADQTLVLAVLMMTDGLSIAPWTRLRLGALGLLGGRRPVGLLPRRLRAGLGGIRPRHEGAASRTPAQRVGIVLALAATWMASFLPSYLISRTMISPEPFLKTWWDFAFLRPPRSVADLSALF